MAVNQLDLFVFEVLDKVAAAKTKEEKIKLLRQHESWALKDILNGTFNEAFKWNLPPGKPPYRASRPESAPTNLLRQNVQFRYFFEGGPGDKLSPPKRESLFIGLLEGIHPDDALVVLNMIAKKSPKGITKKLAEEAFNGLLSK
tara:strand:+ start:3448 stop:3879 length:432 start_codon:yes stop_codon:yes gene_type:complete